jgi:hypothetical protein
LYFAQRAEGSWKSDMTLSFNMKKEVAKIPIKEREIAKQAAGILE